jgi:purine-binding chemotaxis protein CheW
VNPEDAPSQLMVDTPAPAAAPLRFRDRARARQGSAELLVFRVGDERFAVELRSVDEAVESPEIRLLPDSPVALLGVFSHRDFLVPLYSCASMLGVGAAPGATALVMRSGARRIGIAVDDVEDVLPLDLSMLRDAPDELTRDDLLLGLALRARDLVAVLDTRALLAVAASSPVPTEL